MPNWSTLILFAAASILVFTPGRIRSTSSPAACSKGAQQGIVSSLGVETGTLIHVVAVALGISALL